MPDTVVNELLIFFWSVVAGALVSFIFDLFRIKRRTIKTGRVLTVIEDLLYWLIVSLVMFSIIYLTNDGIIRGYTFIGVFLGVLIYLVGLSPVVIKSSLYVINVAVKIFRKLVWVVSIPVNFIFKILKPVFKLLKSKSKCAGKRINQGRRFCTNKAKGNINKLKTKIHKKKS